MASVQTTSEGIPVIVLKEGSRQSLSGREQLAVEKFAEALESIPLALARNAGMNPIDAITQLRAKQNAGKDGLELT